MGYDDETGINPYYKINPSTNNNIFPSLPFAPLDPLSVLFLRIPKSASTRFLTLASNLSHKKNFKITEFPDLRDAVGGSSESSKDWDPKRQFSSSMDRDKYFNGVMAKLYMGVGSRGISSLPSSSPSSTSDGTLSMYTDSQNRTLRALYYGHLFLPPFERFRHFKQQDEDSNETMKLVNLHKIPSVVTFIRDPIKRFESAYNYVRVGARTKAHRRMVVEKLGNSSLTDCIEDETCVDVNQLRKSCSLMARYICGDHPECTVRWHDVDYDNHEEKVASLVERAKYNIKNEILFTGVTEKMQESMDILESLLPTYFEEIGEESRRLDEEVKKSKEQAAFERNFKQGKAVNVAPEYRRVNTEERDAIIKRKICYTDFEVYKYAEEVLEERHKIWKERNRNAPPPKSKDEF
ncbi:hypothetical protein TrVE_jg4460 [Triparma verrucosa]|uniref:Sulfotransferase n=1 Tax=Triparma verrucosa TaxID=1606542 RepID=A0A9W7FDU2_9STRA|nr:hypothetical protein TrVE_jg4460 [Triparma verrucosa]